jgi:hypothetical protein
MGDCHHCSELSVATRTINWSTPSRQVCPSSKQHGHFSCCMALLECLTSVPICSSIHSPSRCKEGSPPVRHWFGSGVSKELTRIESQSSIANLVFPVRSFWFVLQYSQVWYLLSVGGNCLLYRIYPFAISPPSVGQRAVSQQSHSSCEAFSGHLMFKSHRGSLSTLLLASDEASSHLQTLYQMC